MATSDTSTVDDTTSVWNGDTSDAWQSTASSVDGVTTYSITSADELAGLAAYVNSGNSLSGCVVNLTVDVDLNNVTWTPIGTIDNSFSGTFNGNNHTIENLKNTQYLDYVGLFGFIKSAKINDISISGANIIGESGVGAVVGWADQSNETGDSTITGCSVSGAITITGYYCVGGILGCGQRSSVISCSVTGNGSTTSYVRGVYDDNDLEGDNVGGVIGFLGVTQNTGLISKVSGNSASNITVSGSRKVGGILGYTDVMGTDEGRLNITGSTVTSCTITLVVVDEYANNEDILKRIFVGAVLGEGLFTLTISDSTITDVTLGYINPACVYGGEDDTVANRGYYGGSRNTSTEITLTDCEGEATLTQIATEE